VTPTDAEGGRYSGQLGLDGWTGATQERLLGRSAIVVGAGALGSAAATHLAAAGVGRLGIVDGGDVTARDLHGASLHFTPDVGQSRAESAVAKLGLLNPDIQADAYPVAVEEANAEAILAGASVVVDCSGSSRTRTLVNRACCATGAALVTGGARELGGFAMSVRPGESACYLCAFPDPDGPFETAGGALGAVAALVGAIQGLEALKLLAGVGKPLLDRVLRLDGGDWSQTLTPISRRNGCPACAGLGAQPQSG
jgi:molybdopterin/thiamine biosynthesis adenylyltransferase